ncbi:hypothetical protein HY990_07460 [Candidatus Micrarchaeota archaeon]|nr:hypothetical protein [Candidatus Micrarchaeota archaeon]
MVRHDRMGPSGVQKWIVAATVAAGSYFGTVRGGKVEDIIKGNAPVTLEFA